MTLSVADPIQSSDRFQELVEEMAERFYDQEYKDDRIPDIKASFRREAEEAGLPEGEASGVAGLLMGALTSAAKEEALPEPTDKWAVKWHTTLALSDLLTQGDVPKPVKVLLAEKLQPRGTDFSETPSGPSRTSTPTPLCPGTGSSG